MRTTLVLDDNLVKQAKERLGPGSFRSIVENTLREAIKAKARTELIRAIDDGRFDLDITVEENKRLRQDNKEHDREWMARADST